MNQLSDKVTALLAQVDGCLNSSYIKSDQAYSLLRYIEKELPLIAKEVKDLEQSSQITGEELTAYQRSCTCMS